MISQLETVPRQKLEYKGTIFEEMDVDAILARKPQVVLVDELAHTNIPGSKHRKRYEDVQEILAAKIDVLSTMNIQHMESVAPTVRAITGITVRETVPDWVPLMANETVMVDLTPEALQNRMQRGDVYAADKVSQALQEFLPRRKSDRAARTGPAPGDRARGSQPRKLHGGERYRETWPVRERLAVCISSNPAAQYLIARAARMARRLDAEFYVIYVDIGRKARGADQKSLEANLQFAEDLGAKVARLKGRNVADAVAEFVREKHITQVIFGRSSDQGLRNTSISPR